MRVRGRTRRVIGALAVAVVATATLAVTPTPAADAAVSVPCPQPTGDGLVPTQVGQRYGLQQLWDAGYRGQGIVVGLVEIGTAVETDVLAGYQACLGQQPTPFTTVQVGAPGTLLPSNEAMSDAEMVVGLAPAIDGLWEFTNAGGTVEDFADTLEAALDPANYGGRVPDVVSISFNNCEATFPTDVLNGMETALANAAARGTWVVKGAGDSGSSACAGHGPGKGTTGCASSPPQPLAVDYPAASPYVVATGGIMVTSGDPVTTLGTTWLQNCGGTGGGVSSVFAAPPWQAQAVNRAPQAMRTVPDIASIAGSPGYEFFVPNDPQAPTWVWQPIDGDSMTGPFHAAAFAVVRQALRARGIAVPTVQNLMQSLYDPANYSALFADVTEGLNTVYNVECCFAGPGYDLTTGLGQLKFPELVSTLAAAAVRPVPVVVPPAFTG